MRNHINIFIHNDEVYFLSGIVLLIGMIGKLPHVASRQMEEYFFGKGSELPPDFKAPEAH